VRGREGKKGEKSGDGPGQARWLGLFALRPAGGLSANSSKNPLRSRSSERASGGKRWRGRPKKGNGSTSGARQTISSLPSLSLPLRGINFSLSAAVAPSSPPGQVWWVQKREKKAASALDGKEMNCAPKETWPRANRSPAGERAIPLMKIPHPHVTNARSSGKKERQGASFRRRSISDREHARSLGRDRPHPSVRPARRRPKGASPRPSRSTRLALRRSNYGGARLMGSRGAYLGSPSIATLVSSLITPRSLGGRGTRWSIQSREGGKAWAANCPPFCRPPSSLRCRPSDHDERERGPPS